MINFILWLLFGALVGWLASMVMRTDAQQGGLGHMTCPVFGKKYFLTLLLQEGLSDAVYGADFRARCRSTNRRCRIALSSRWIADLHESLHVLGGREPG